MACRRRSGSKRPRCSRGARGSPLGPSRPRRVGGRPPAVFFFFNVNHGVWGWSGGSSSSPYLFGRPSLQDSRPHETRPRVLKGSRTRVPHVFPSHGASSRNLCRVASTMGKSLLQPGGGGKGWRLGWHFGLVFCFFSPPPPFFSAPVGCCRLSLEGFPLKTNYKKQVCASSQVKLHWVRDLKGATGDTAGSGWTSQIASKWEG